MLSNTQESKNIGRNLRKIRLQKGLMQIDVAAASDLNRTYVSRIETDKMLKVLVEKIFPRIV